jgi:hypothetical protein
MPETPPLLTGKCMCGAIEYSVEDAFEYAMNCHCSNCRRTTGSAFKPIAGIRRERFQLVKGAEAMLIYGNPDETHDVHCGICGSLVYSVVRERAYAHVPMGTLMDALRSGRRRIFSSARRHHGMRLWTICRSIGNFPRGDGHACLVRRSPKVPSSLTLWRGYGRRAPARR